MIKMNYTISLTNKCNLNCEYCYEKNLNTELGSLSEDTARYTVNFLKNKPIDILYLFGGEPLLMKEMIKYLTLNIKAEKYVITTNGVLLEENFVKWCSDNNVAINLSHDGKDCSKRGLDVSFLNEKLKLLLKYRPETLVQMVYNEESLMDLEKNILYFKELGVKKVFPAMDSFLKPKDIDAFADNMKMVWERLYNITDIYILQFGDKIKVLNGKPITPCEIGKKNMYINWDGKIYPCVQFQNREEFCAGDVINGLNIKPLLQRHPNYSNVAKRCDGCEISQYCQNACACRKMSSTNGLDDISEAACIEQQVLLLTILNKQINEIYRR